MSPKGRNGKHKNAIKMQTNSQPIEVRERLEIVQNVIDRMLYLSEGDKQKFLNNLETLFNVYPLDKFEIEFIDGIRVYKPKK